MLHEIELPRMIAWLLECVIVEGHDAAGSSGAVCAWIHPAHGSKRAAAIPTEDRASMSSNSSI